MNPVPVRRARLLDCWSGLVVMLLVWNLGCEPANRPVGPEEGAPLPVPEPAAKALADTARALPAVEVRRVSYRLGFFAVDPAGQAYGAADKTLYRIVDRGNAVEAVYTFAEPIQGLHFLANGCLFVSTDHDRWSPDTPCRIYRSTDQGRSFVRVKTLTASCALWWSFASDQYNTLYMGEYGPRERGRSKKVWKSTDQGQTWTVAFQAPDLDGVHIHRVAVDPYTGDLWVTNGDGAHGATYLWPGGSGRWFWQRASQATSVVFTEEGICWGEDTYEGTLTWYDRRTQTYQKTLQANREGNYGGSVYDMVRGRSGLIYAPMVKYAEQTHRPSLWVGDGRRWKLLLDLGNKDGKYGGFTQISPPDQWGYLYAEGYKIKDPN
ncbi:MAG: hypothetical protein IT369_04320 [Candidatus Latescibacteria bacterium]|nr:hypothetical protein [Candidatus Latescibacterota bacterium]